MCAANFHWNCHTFVFTSQWFTKNLLKLSKMESTLYEFNFQLKLICSPKNAYFCHPFYELWMFKENSCLCLLFHSEHLRQTIPQSNITCPGQMLQYTCTYPGTELFWSIGSSQPVTFDGNTAGNTNANIGDFSLVLLGINATNISSTATNNMVASTYDGQQIACYSGNIIRSLTISVAGIYIHVVGFKLVTRFWWNVAFSNILFFFFANHDHLQNSELAFQMS